MPNPATSKKQELAQRRTASPNQNPHSASDQKCKYQYATHPMTSQNKNHRMKVNMGTNFTSGENGRLDGRTAAAKAAGFIAGAHKLGPKANQGAINEKLRALDRTNKPCRKCQR